MILFLHEPGILANRHEYTIDTGQHSQYEKLLYVTTNYNSIGAYLRDASLLAHNSRQHDKSTH